MARWIFLAVGLTVFVVLALTWSVEGAVLIVAYVVIFMGVGWVTGGFGGAVSRWAGRIYGDDTSTGDAERHAQKAPLFRKPPRP